MTEAVETIVADAAEAIVRPQGDSWSCALCSLEYLTGTPRSEIAAELGHDGSEVIDESQEAPFNRATLLEYESILYLFRKGHQPTSIITREWIEHVTQNHYPKRYTASLAELKSLLSGKAAELTVRSARFPKAFHAVACLNGIVLDPRDGGRHSLEEYEIAAVIFTNIDPYQRLSQLHLLK